MGKLIAYISGGLGNQLFQYAAARSLALKNSCELVLNNISGFERDFIFGRHYQLDHFNIKCRKANYFERLEPFSRARNLIIERLNQSRPFMERSYLKQEGIDFDPRLLIYKPNGTTYLKGYWQSEKYFSEFEEQIRCDLSINPPSDRINGSFAKSISATNSVALHVRFFRDPLQTPDIGAPWTNASQTYYQSAIRTMDERVDNAHYYLFSDNPQAARNLFWIDEKRVTVVQHNVGDHMAYADLWLMSRCRHFIIANSTFSWWGAWLATYKDKVIIAPNIVSRDGNGWGFSGLLPDKWIKL